MKETIKIILIIIALLLGVIFIVTNFFYKSFEEKYQYDADIVRLNHLQYYVTLIEEHKEKTWKYPLEDKTKTTEHTAWLTDEQKKQISTLPVYVTIANKLQEEEAKRYTNAIPFSHKNSIDKEFFKELEEGLEKSINEYYDPQKVASWRPNFYVYVVDKDGNYYFAIHTYKKYPFGISLGENYHKIEVSNNKSSQSILANKLFQDEAFLKELNKEIKKQSFFLDLEKQYINDSKTIE